MKRGFLISSSFLALTNFVSAQYYSGYNNFSPRGAFSDILSQETITYGFLFIIFFSFLFFILSKMIKNSSGGPNKGIAGVIAFAISGLILQGVYKSGFDPTNKILDPILPFLVLGGIILLIWKIGISNLLIILGLLLISLTFTDMIYEKGIVLLLGIALLILGMWMRRNKNSVPETLPPAGIVPEGVQANNPQQTQVQIKKRRNEQEKLDLARKIGIRNLTREYEKLKKEYENGLEEAKDLHQKSTKLGWNKTKEGNRYYKAWYRQYNRNIQIEKRTKEILERINHLRK